MKLLPVYWVWRLAGATLPMPMATLRMLVLGVPVLMTLMAALTGLKVACKVCDFIVHLKFLMFYTLFYLRLGGEVVMGDSGVTSGSSSGGSGEVYCVCDDSFLDGNCNRSSSVLLIGMYSS